MIEVIELIEIIEMIEVIENQRHNSAAEWQLCIMH
jgi:hypothetical protein